MIQYYFSLIQCKYIDILLLLSIMILLVLILLLMLFCCCAMYYVNILMSQYTNINIQY